MSHSQDEICQDRPPEVANNHLKLNIFNMGLRVSCITKSNTDHDCSLFVEEIFWNNNLWCTQIKIDVPI